jgi:integrating conjugative element membrane protein (TIGR03745 family)
MTLKRRLNDWNLRAGLAVLALVLWADTAWPGLPKPAIPAGGSFAQADWITTLGCYVKQGGSLALLFISLAGFAWTGWHALADVNEARRGDKEWGDVGLSVSAAVAVFLWVSFLVAQGDTVFGDWAAGQCTAAGGGGGGGG